MQKHFYANGKLLITGEYLVMEGAKALAIPLKLGQHLDVFPGDEQQLRWQAWHPDGLWFEAVFSLPSIQILNTTHKELASRLCDILKLTQALSGTFLSGEEGFMVKTRLDFNPDFGFGSSSSMIVNLASWAGIDPYLLQQQSFGGSGYDIACASANGPIVYCLNQGRAEVVRVDFHPSFSDHLYFVYLGHKQRSSQSIINFRKTASFNTKHIRAVNDLTKQLISTQHMQEFEDLMMAHEKLMAAVLQQPTVQSQLFADFDGVVKSLGGWGGDFVLVSSILSKPDLVSEMSRRAFPIVYDYDSLVL